MHRLASAIAASFAALAVPGPAALAAQVPTDLLPTSANQGEIARILADKAGGDLRDFYSRRGYWPLWIENGQLSQAAYQLVPMLETAQLDGLRARDYDAEELTRLAAQARSGDPAALAKAELAFSRAFARYVTDLRQPSVEMNYFSELAKPQTGDASEILRRAALSTDFTGYIARMGWMSPHYVRLRAALAEGSGDVALPVVSHGPTLRQGDRGLRVVQLRRRLGLLESDIFDGVLYHAVQDFQRQRGLTPDGVVGPQTVSAMNHRRGHDTAALQRNIQRLRALPGPYEKHVVVNAATQELVYYDEGREQGRMKVVVGTPDTPTPMMAGVLAYATLNPYWNVPVSLVQKRIAPAVARGNSLDAMGYEVLSDWTADAQVLDWRSVDWKAAARGETQLRVRELPGSGNAMGDVKFMFPNDMGIFLHDTDGKHLFRKRDRFFSNGCVRLEAPRELGAFLFGKPMPAPSSDQPEQHVPLPRPVPVFITYLTAEPAGDGGIAYHDDRYGWDRGPLMARR
ncbi:murein L,D-transpeptidase [Paraurantiacibacter namhicola]|uniref:Murein L,D-transpeptidase n=2 Tax=Paraurantiacibacter namhicola TaxID=645517 RepID=A0A1C7D4U0_9SPHN|nr:murein L,D-transpeptidase [Paraurantiacibacter namhicola]